MSVRGRATAAVALVLLLAGCGMTEYRGPESGIDGTLWRAVSTVEDRVRSAVSESRATDADVLVASLPATSWNGTAADLPDLDRAIAIVYDVSTSGSRASFSIFATSGQRPDVPTDAGRAYDGPDSVFTCWRMDVVLGVDGVAAEDTYFDGPDSCPAVLVDAMPGVPAYAETLVFSG